MLSVHFTDREVQVLLRLANAVLDGDIHWPGEVSPRGEDAGAARDRLHAAEAAAVRGR